MRIQRFFFQSCNFPWVRLYINNHAFGHLYVILLNKRSPQKGRRPPPPPFPHESARTPNLRLSCCVWRALFALVFNYNLKEYNWNRTVSSISWSTNIAVFLDQTKLLGRHLLLFLIRFVPECSLSSVFNILKLILNLPTRRKNFCTTFFKTQ